eukprot:scaffold170460_cov44-Attheya_sp.AAC.1
MNKESEIRADTYGIKATQKPTDTPTEFAKGARNQNRAIQGKSPLKNEKGYTYGRVAQRAHMSEIKRSYFSSKVVNFDDLEGLEGSKKVFELIAVYVLLVLKSFRKYTESSKDVASMTVFAARALQPSQKTFALKEIQLPKSIDFHSEFCFNDKHDYFAVYQLGYGCAGVSCLSINQDGVACVLKFLHQHPAKESGDMLELAKEEAAYWTTIYGLSAGAFAIDKRIVIAMPYLEVPSNYDDRQRLIGEGKSEQDGPLYRGLLEFYKKGYTHNEVYWHHIGVQAREQNLCILCDLGHISTNDEFSDEKMTAWVQTNFENLKQRNVRSDSVSNGSTRQPGANGHTDSSQR